MVPTRYPALAGLLAGLVTLGNLVVTYVHAWVDGGVTVVAGYYTATAWLSLLLVPLGTAVVGYAGGRASIGEPDLERTGLVCLAVGVAASLIAVGIALAVRPDSVGTGASSLMELAGFTLTVIRPVVVATVAAVAGAALVRT